jgi:hypothetical protein
MARERRSHEYDEWLKKLRDQSKVTINEEELAKVTVESAPPAPGTTPTMSSLPHPVSPAQMKSATAPQAPGQTPPTAAAKIGGQ